MKKLLFILALALVLAGCPSPVITNSGGGHKMYVVNSLWQVVKTVEVSSSRELVTDDINVEIEAYNAETLDDFLRVYVDEIPDLSDAPPVSVYICNPANYNVNMAQHNIPRQSLIDNIDGWRADSVGQLLFIDHVPPKPIVIPPPSMYAWYAIYAVDTATGDIMYEDHCGWTAAEVWDGQWILDGGWRDADHYRETARYAINSEVIRHSGWVLIERQLYKDPTP